MTNLYETGMVAFSPKKILVHEDWNSQTKKYDADISLLEFDEGNIHFNDYIQPICVWNYGSEPTVSDGIVIGWGVSEDKTKSFENKPKKITVQIQDTVDCFLDSIELVKFSSRRIICAGLKNGSGVCHGDDGGGLFGKVSGVYYLKGIVSAGLNTDDYGCDISQNAIYTDVPKFRDWIEEIAGSTLLSPPARKSDCGVSKRTTGLIFGGQSFKRGSFPWLVALKYTAYIRPTFICGATLISSTFVISGKNI